jgi:hypothetical protein
MTRTSTRHVRVSRKRSSSLPRYQTTGSMVRLAPTQLFRSSSAPAAIASVVSVNESAAAAASSTSTSQSTVSVMRGHRIQCPSSGQRSGCAMLHRVLYDMPARGWHAVHLQELVKVQSVVNPPAAGPDSFPHLQEEHLRQVAYLHNVRSCIYAMVADVEHRFSGPDVPVALAAGAKLLKLHCDVIAESITSGLSKESVYLFPRVKATLPKSNSNSNSQSQSNSDSDSDSDSDSKSQSRSHSDSDSESAVKFNSICNLDEAAGFVEKMNLVGVRVMWLRSVCKHKDREFWWLKSALSELNEAARWECESPLFVGPRMRLAQYRRKVQAALQAFQDSGGDIDCIEFDDTNVRLPEYSVDDDFGDTDKEFMIQALCFNKEMD